MAAWFEIGLGNSSQDKRLRLCSWRIRTAVHHDRLIVVNSPSVRLKEYGVLKVDIPSSVIRRLVAQEQLSTEF
ncbi:hypothetical protein AtubIFM55763_010303 [Aspergillus tubingensis]|uniref:Uncharacterized protein n=1 Tax=Aspergillus tubingensis TaxID=5068 RepID=A0A9W6AQI3_ASPTU|nr:hypothetical protein AtubIFM54640_002358 [Aspergillus tubingensis]GLA69784.1 hypothetical protein AtubIFM55763_010303 [Aspergillus tubingensis]GLA86033.1 hypothetical protein AtubIFM56815_010283 [Aspergillus tubingensis]GLA92609.1 hypothetical protein AtubIFM57143_008962 [Aspergillus tubingensis]GLB16011.1 hypothetical protein AtubIFM61612_005846 [Aspergillus tubingensis]